MSAAASHTATDGNGVLDPQAATTIASARFVLSDLPQTWGVVVTTDDAPRSRSSDRSSGLVELVMTVTPSASDGAW